MPSFVGAIDNGTTSSRFLIFDENGNLVIGHQLEYRQIFSQSGWVEQDPMDILGSVISCIEGALRKFKLQGNDARNLKGIGITNQRETTVVWDRNTGKPLHNAIVWSDTRTQDIVKKLAGPDEGGADALRDICGLPITTYFSAVKLRWLLENSTEVKEAHDNGSLMFGTVDSWLIYNLTGGKEGGVHVTDVTNASRTMLMDIKTLQWSDRCLDFFGIKAEILPEIKPSSTLFGKMNHVELNEIKDVPIAGCLGDQHAALVGQHCFQAGEAKNTYGTGCFMVFNTGTEPIPSKNGLLTTVGYQFEGEPAVYALEGSIAVAGSAVKWLRDSMGVIKSAEDINGLAESVKDNGGVVFVTAFSGLFAPYWRPDVRGCILGISQHTTKGHLARATLEATCFQTRAILDAMNADSGKPLKLLRVDGGLSNSDICMQMQADILGIDVVRPQMRESTALGAATAAAIYLGIGIWEGGFKAFAERSRNSTESLQTFAPEVSEKARDDQYSLWQRAIEKCLSWDV
ncbi:glycerol kinase [Entomortierella parvispora]|uniref:glycerol kinase n=1 Tax=Entomortierella parvispora TaxID=205924 RepID=A0A9P3HFC6_9FUNG|nr:glycerol kinase [Entomortierella parvispora]